MGNKSTDKRIEYLIKEFNVFDIDDEDEVLGEYGEEGFESIIQVQDPLDDTIIAYHSEKYRNERSTKMTKKVSVEVTLLGRMIAADPTNNKMFVQWMLKVFTNMLKNGSDNDAIRFACEDLVIAKEYLEVFETNKRKRNFTKYCKANFNLNHIRDYTNINQYNNLSELFDAVDPFVEKDVSGLKRAMQRFVDMREAKITFKDRHFMVYTPLTKEAATVFHKFTKWCTAIPSQTNFRQYTTHNRPDGKPSKLYVIIPTDLFEDVDSELYQIHFETSQFMDKSDRPVKSLDIFHKSESLKEYIMSELRELIGMSSGTKSNTYMSWLYRFDMGYLLFELMDYDLTSLRVKDKPIVRIPNTIANYNRLTRLALTGCKILSVDPSIGDLENLELLSLNRNSISKLPDTIGKLKNLRYLSLGGNPIFDLPESIKELDKSKGGSLDWVSVGNSLLAEDFKTYLPNVKVIDNAKYEYYDDGL